MTKKKNNDFLATWSEKVTYMLVLGFLGIICSIPVITLGASLTAMHKAMKCYVCEGEKKIFTSFFAAFKKHFKQSTLIWLMNLIIIFVLCFDLLFYGGSENWVQMAGMTIVTISLMAVVFEMTMSFVLVAEELTTGVKDTILCALQFGLKCPYEALMMLLLNLAIPGLFFLFMMQLLVLSPGILSYLQWQFLPKTFERFKEKIHL